MMFFTDAHRCAQPDCGTYLTAVMKIHEEGLPFDLPLSCFLWIALVNVVRLHRWSPYFANGWHICWHGRAINLSQLPCFDSCCLQSSIERILKHFEAIDTSKPPPKKKRQRQHVHARWHELEQSEKSGLGTSRGAFPGAWFLGSRSWFSHLISLGLEDSA